MAKKKTDPVDVHVGSRVRATREAMGLSQTALAKHCGITYQQIQKYERGVNTLSAGRLHRVAKVLRVRPSSFFKGAPGELTVDRNAKRQHESAQNLIGLLRSAQGVELNSAFVRITDAKLRRHIIDLVRMLAEKKIEWKTASSTF